MKARATDLPDVLLLEPKVFEDARGFFFESFNLANFETETGLAPTFVQDNHSRSVRGTLRGLHFQIRQPQAKLVRAVAGTILDVAVDLRRASPTFGKWTAEVLSAENRRQMWVPVGFAHGFSVLSDHAEVLYKATDYYAPEHERCLRWDDSSVAVDWRLESEEAPVISAKDLRGTRLESLETFE